MPINGSVMGEVVPDQPCADKEGAPRPGAAVNP